MKIKIEDLHNTLDKFIKKINLNLILGTQRATYNKIGLSYKPKNNVNIFSNICHVNRSSKYNVFKCNYCNKMTMLLYFVLLEKVMKEKYLFSISFS